METTSERVPRWKKLLYERQPYGDNYVDESFLSSLVKLDPAVEMSYWSAVCNSFPVVLQFSAVSLTSLVCYFSLTQAIHRIHLLLLDALVAIVPCYALWGNKGSSPKWQPVKHYRPCCFRLSLLVVGLYALSPILKTLTQSISSDTIWTSTGVLYFVHLLTNDYTFANAIASKPNGCVSLMASVLASLLLSSRLNSQEEVFGFIVFALELVILYPRTIHQAASVSAQAKKVLGAALVMLPPLLLFFLGSTLCGWLYIASQLCISFVCPCWYVRMQKKHRHKFSGPWDEAKIHP